ncbi:hypothetical protein QCA50_020872 [Cerrena zonata]|uniref:Uncharacterized protein n=1 Tax=Cerrena zonata TaxID=2478898 RepID=A0AAW0F8T1_9APHY
MTTDTSVVLSVVTKGDEPIDAFPLVCIIFPSTNGRMSEPSSAASREFSGHLTIKTQALTLLNSRLFIYYPRFR